MKRLPYSNDDNNSSNMKRCCNAEEKIYITLTDDVRDKFIAEYENQPCMWDPNKKDYRNYSATA